jgi:hypothetical protein
VHASNQTNQTNRSFVFNTNFGRSVARTTQIVETDLPVCGNWFALLDLLAVEFCQAIENNRLVSAAFKSLFARVRVLTGISSRGVRVPGARVLRLSTGGPLRVVSYSTFIPVQVVWQLSDRDVVYEILRTSEHFFPAASRMFKKTKGVVKHRARKTHARADLMPVWDIVRDYVSSVYTLSTCILT